MKVIIRDLETGLYVSSLGHWAQTQNEAMAFKNSIAALEYCVAQRIHGVEILLLDPQIGPPLRLFPRDTIGVGIPAMDPPNAPAFAGAS